MLWNKSNASCLLKLRRKKGDIESGLIERWYTSTFVYKYTDATQPWPALRINYFYFEAWERDGCYSFFIIYYNRSLSLSLRLYTFVIRRRGEEKGTGKIYVILHGNIACIQRRVNYTESGAMVSIPGILIFWTLGWTDYSYIRDTSFGPYPNEYPVIILSSRVSS